MNNGAEGDRRYSGQAKEPARVALYASLGPQLVHHEVDVGGLALVRRGPVTLPADVQYAWPHALGHHLYVASGQRTPPANKHHATTFHIDPLFGTLEPQGKEISLAFRPIHITTDARSEHALITYNFPSSLSVHRINPDGTLGEEVKQPGSLDTGYYAHQIRVISSNKVAILVTRGNKAADGKPEDPGALKVFDYKDGVLTNQTSIAPGGGYGFGPRHIDFHESQPWVFVSLERQNKLCVFKLDADTLDDEPLFVKDTLADPISVRPGQVAGTVHVHPGGGFVYGCNRASGTRGSDGKPVFVGGENNIVVYAINQYTGEPTLIQRVDTYGISPRTFAIDPSGRMLVVANQKRLLVPDGAGVRAVPASLAVFRICTDGTLEYVRKYDVDVGSDSIVWMGMVAF